MYKLMISRDAGYSYNFYGEDENLEVLKKRAKKYDDEGLWWTIDNEQGEPVEFSLIHKQIVAFEQRRKG